MHIGPLIRAMGRNRTRFALIILEIALTLAIVTNCLNIILDQRKGMQKRSGFDDAADPVLRNGARVQPVQQLKGRTRTILGEQDARQQQMFGLGWIVRLVASAEALLIRPAGRARSGGGGRGGRARARNRGAP